MRRTRDLLWILGAVLMVGCGSDGSSHDGNGASATTGTPISTTQNGITLTEKIDLNQNLNGVWIEYSSVDFVSETIVDGAAVHAQSSETARKTIFVIDIEGEDLMVGDCQQNATDIQRSASALEFTLGTARYVLEKKSNTHLSGNFDFDAEIDQGNASGQGESDIVKVGVGPATLGALITGYQIGLVKYSIYGGAQQQVDMQCISDSVGNSTVTRADGSVTTYSYSGVVVESMWGDFLSMSHNSAIPGQKRLTASLLGSAFDITSEAERDYINFSTGGVNNPITIEFSGLADRYASDDVNGDTATLSGEASLSL